MQNKPNQSPGELAYKAIYPRPMIAMLCFLIAYLVIATLLVFLEEPFIPLLFGIAVTIFLSVYLTKLTIQLLDMRKALRSEKYDLPYSQGIQNEPRFVIGLTIFLFIILLFAFLKFAGLFI